MGPTDHYTVEAKYRWFGTPRYWIGGVGRCHTWLRRKLTYGFCGAHISHGSVETELWALYHGLQLAVNRGYKPIEKNTDAQAVTTLLQTSQPLYANIINDCRFLLARLDDPTILLTYKEQNQVADLLAKFGCNMDPTVGITLFCTVTTFYPNSFERRSLRHTFLSKGFPLKPYSSHSVCNVPLDHIFVSPVTRESVVVALVTRTSPM